MLRLIETTYSYDAWATDRLLDAMEDLTAAEYAGLAAGARGSIRDSFAHLLLERWRVFCWLDGSLSLAETAELRIDAENLPSVHWARRRWNVLNEQVAWFVGSLSEEDLHRERQGTLPDGSEVRLPLWTILLHVINESTHTRAQIAAAFERAGRPVESTDLLAYAQCKRIRGAAA